MKAIADTGFVVAFGNRRDKHHVWAVALAEQITAPMLTCDAVLSEAAFHLRSSELVLAMVSEGLLRSVFDPREHVDRLRQLAKQFEDRQPDLADLCIVRLSELYPKLPVVTVDASDFHVYRRNNREAIPLLLPRNSSGKKRRPS